MDAVSRAARFAESKGTVNVAGAGNENYDLASDSITDPSSPNDGTPSDRVVDPSKCLDIPTQLPGMVTVAATGAKGIKSSFSNYGLGAVATAFHSERRLLVDGRAPVTFAPLSRFWRTADGWVGADARELPAPPGAAAGSVGAPEDVAAVEAALAERSSLEVEEAVSAAGGLAVALRSAKEWAAHEQAVAVAARPLVERERLDSARARSPRSTGLRCCPRPDCGSST